jgi:Ca2+/Na+ antiporter
MKKTNHTLLKVLRGLLFILALIILVLGILGAFSLISMRSALPNMLIGLQAIGLGVFVDLLTGVLGPVFINLGIAVLVIALVMSLLAFAAGQLIGTTLEIDKRLAMQEKQLEVLRRDQAFLTTDTQAVESHV